MITNNNYTGDGIVAIDFQRIRELNPLVEYCENHGIQLRRSSNRWIGKCPFHNEQNGEAFVIHPDQKWQCYGRCDRQGDVVDLERELHGGDIAEAAGRLDPGNMRNNSAQNNIIAVPAATVQPKLVPTKENPFALPYVLSTDEKKECHRFTLQLLEDQTFIERISRHRQWKAESVRQLALDGYLGRDDDGHICFNSAAGCKARWRQDGERRFKFLFGKSWLWRGELIPEAETVYITEGETDAITLIDCGLEDDGKTAVIGLQGATFNIEPWSFLFAGKDVIVSTDYDEAGRKASSGIKLTLLGADRSIKYLRLDQEGKQHV
jgi:hypothetical protein